jgi:phosphoribosyl 1,2-cyclic phosphate phosphodiesterase
MKITYYGTSASEAWPALFCNCKACSLARQLGGKNIRTRSQILIDDTLLIDFPPDTNYHSQRLNLDLQKVCTLLITHSHHDHFFPYDICMRTPNYAAGISNNILSVYGNDTVIERLKKVTAEYVGTEQVIELHLLNPFESIVTQDGYKVTALLADHNQPEKSLMYIIERAGKKLLYAHDTGIFPESTWQFIQGMRFDFVSLDCTALSRDWRQGHMGFEAVDIVRARLTKINCMDSDTLIVLNHFAHFEDFTHEKICKMENPKGYEVAYDGCSYEF